MRRIRENYVTGSSCTIVLVGRDTWGRKFVDWEIMATLDKGHGLIGVQLPTAPVQSNNTIIVPDRLHDNIQSGYALWLSWQQITASAQTLAQHIAHANRQDKRLIRNNRERRLRNA
jgi:antiphage defense system Thoeris ThsB-like protein